MKEEVLTIDVVLDDVIEVNGSAGKACMILFHGRSDCRNFKGRVLPGGVDTQREPYGEKRLLSARYILEGTDCAGKSCRIFIENNGVVETPGSDVVTTPIIYTDSEELRWLESARLTGRVTGKPGGVIISFYRDEM